SHYTVYSPILSSFVFSSSLHLLFLHSFPTRRSSDLFVRSVYCFLLYMAVCSPASAQEGQKPALVTAPEVEPGRAELKNLVIKNVRLFAWQEVYKKRKYVEVLEFRETQGLHLIPSNKFDVRCE